MRSDAHQFHVAPSIICSVAVNLLQVSDAQRTIQALDENEGPVRRPTLPTQKSRPKPDARRGRDHRQLGAEARTSYTRHHSWVTWIDSSARLESVAHVENTVADVYYRNDPMKSVALSVTVGEV